MDVHGAFSLTQSPQALPGKCAQCGKAKDPLGFIDTGLQFDYWGALIFCSECVLDMASKYGYINTAAADALHARINELERETIVQREAILGLEQIVDGLQHLSSVYSGGDDPDSSPAVVPEIEETITVPQQQSDSVVEEPESNVISGEHSSDELVSEQVPVGVSGNSNLVNLDELEF